MKLDDLPKNIQTIFISMLQAAMELRHLGEEKEKFLTLASETWEIMCINTNEVLLKLIIKKMKTDIEDYLKEKVL